MQSLEDAMAKICELRGSLMAMECLLSAIVLTMPAVQRQHARAQLRIDLEACRSILLGAQVSEHTLQQFERDALRASTMLD
jgi:hypothetical protein